MSPSGPEQLCVDYFALDDASFILELLNEPDFISNIADKGVRDISCAEAYLRDGSMASYVNWSRRLRKVSLKQTGETIRMYGLIRDDSLDHPDSGYAFLKRQQGQGYASESRAGVLERAPPAIAYEPDRGDYRARRYRIHSGARKAGIPLRRGNRGFRLQQAEPVFRL